MSNAREVVTCPHCSLKQFMTVSGACRKCRQALNVPKFEKPAPTLITPKLLASPKPKRTVRRSVKEAAARRRIRAGALADFKAAKTQTERRAVIAWYLSNKNAPYVPAAL